MCKDFTKSNEWTGRHSFGNRSLHSLGANPNPYEQAISIVARCVCYNLNPMPLFIFIHPCPCNEVSCQCNLQPCPCNSQPCLCNSYHAYVIRNHAYVIIYHGFFILSRPGRSRLLTTMDWFQPLGLEMVRNLYLQLQSAGSHCRIHHCHLLGPLQPQRRTLLSSISSLVGHQPMV